MHLVTYLAFQQESERALGGSFGVVSYGHTGEADVHWTTGTFAQQCAAHAEALGPILARCPAPDEPVPERLHAQGMTSVRSGPAGLLRDLQDLYQLVNLVDITWSLIGQASQAARDRDLLAVGLRCAEQTTAQLDWLRMRMKAAAPQTLLVAT
ncbi:hypothetical protein [Streptomyces sp. NRRL F-5126]|uniref:hypothetical protein n=1 Tax=Streptomyces sp. NRRL F-5126 TaxID=1463857 RepID=UPI0004C81812|nr:hypothetical protein [Streptomyces sp. NRRL F-5126]